MHSTWLSMKWGILKRKSKSRNKENRHLEIIKSHFFSHIPLSSIPQKIVLVQWRHYPNYSASLSSIALLVTEVFRHSLVTRPAMLTASLSQNISRIQSNISWAVIRSDFTLLHLHTPAIPQDRDGRTRLLFSLILVDRCKSYKSAQ